MLYGVRRDLQAALAADGYRVRVYIPFGREWFPYFMRRLAERPANVALRRSRACSANGDAVGRPRPRTAPRMAVIPLKSRSVNRLAEVERLSL